MSYQQLTEGQRYQISVLFAEGYSQAKIADRVDVNRSTISRKLKRYTDSKHYEPAQIHSNDLKRRAQAVKYRTPRDTVWFVEMVLSWDWIPEQISAIAKRINLPVSAEWIYQYIANNKEKGDQLYKHLRQWHKRYRRGKATVRTPISNAISIDERPSIVDTRERIGCWEADTVLGQQSSKCTSDSCRAKK